MPRKLDHPSHHDIHNSLSEDTCLVESSASDLVTKNYWYYVNAILD